MLIASRAHRASTSADRPAPDEAPSRYRVAAGRPGDHLLSVAPWPLPAHINPNRRMPAPVDANTRPDRPGEGINRSGASVASIEAYRKERAMGPGKSARLLAYMLTAHRPSFSIGAIRD